MTLTAGECLKKADRALAAANLLLDNGDLEGACNRAYYAMFDAARAALIAADVMVTETQGKTHRGLIAAFGLHLVKTKRIAAEFGVALSKVERLRLLADYTGEPIPAEEAAWAVEQAKTFVSAIRRHFVTDSS